MHIDVNCKTDKFNLSIEGEDFINPCCFGEDFSQWLVDTLESKGIEADIICMEDFGWANYAKHSGATYLVCVAGNSDEKPDNLNYGTWHVMIEKKRSFKDMIFGKNKTKTSDPLVHEVTKILKAEGFSDVIVEP